MKGQLHFQRIDLQKDYDQNHTVMVLKDLIQWIPKQQEQIEI